METSEERANGSRPGTNTRREWSMKKRQGVPMYALPRCNRSGRGWKDLALARFSEPAEFQRTFCISIGDRGRQWRASKKSRDQAPL
ncbi:MAG TPA: hypothetical protein VHB46_19620 [Burkholderiales bacterium]|nr:hypothetical protein [Burkholderiales bacterium]